MYLPDNSSCSGVYAIRNTYSDRVYVGKSVNMLLRWATHIAALEMGKHYASDLQADWTVDGASAFVFEVIERCEPEELVERETWYIWALRPAYNTRQQEYPGPDHIRARFEMEERRHPVSKRWRSSMRSRL